MARDVQIVERPVGEILGLAEKATRKQYIVRSGNETEVKVRVLKDGGWYVGKRVFQFLQEHKVDVPYYPCDPKGFRISLDDDGHPYIAGKYGSEGFKHYDARSLLSRTISGMGGSVSNPVGEKAFRTAYAAIKRGTKYARLRDAFHQWLEEKGRKAEQIRRTELSKEYLGVGREPPFDPAAYDVLKGQSEYELFCLWYPPGNYVEKVRSSWKERKKAFESWVKKFTDRLEAEGFRLVKKHAIKD